MIPIGKGVLANFLGESSHHTFDGWASIPTRLVVRIFSTSTISGLLPARDRLDQPCSAGILAGRDSVCRSATSLRRAFVGLD